MRRLLVGIVTVSILVGVGGSMSGGLARPTRETAPPAPRFVREAQQALRELGYRPGPVDGVVGPRTKLAIVSFQRAERIQETGLLDPETMVRLDIQHRVLRPAGRG